MQAARQRGGLRLHAGKPVRYDAQGQVGGRVPPWLPNHDTMPPLGANRRTHGGKNGFGKLRPTIAILEVSASLRCLCFIYPAFSARSDVGVPAALP